MTIAEVFLALVAGGVVAKLLDGLIEIIRAKARRGREGVEIRRIEADTGEIVVKSAGEVIYHYQQIVEQLQRDVESLKGRVAELEEQLKHEQELRRDLETSLAAYQSEEK